MLTVHRDLSASGVLSKDSQFTNNQRCHLRSTTRGLCCKRYISHAHLFIYDNILRVTEVYVKILKNDIANIGLQCSSNKSIPSLSPPLLNVQ